MIISKLTKKQKEILNLIPRFRFLNRIQIQQFLHHKYPKCINDWLRDLKEKQYLNWIYDTSFEKKSKPAIYYAGINGIRYLKAEGNIPPSLIYKLYRDKNRSDNFISQCLLLADCFLTFRVRMVNGVNYVVTTASELENSYSPFHFLCQTKLEVHQVIKKTEIKNNQTMMKYFLIHAIEPTLPRYSLRRKLKDYVEFYHEGSWEDHVSKTFPALHFICPDKPVLIYAKRYAKKIMDDNDNPHDLHFCFATVGEIKKHGVNAGIWEEAGKRYVR